jgi:hypothetical protein
MIAAGVNAKALSTYMGHASITITLDRYGHLMPGNEHQAARMLDYYLERTAQCRTLDRAPRLLTSSRSQEDLVEPGTGGPPAEKGAEVSHGPVGCATSGAWAGRLGGLV